MKLPKKRHLEGRTLKVSTVPVLTRWAFRVCVTSVLLSIVTSLSAATLTIVLEDIKQAKGKLLIRAIDRETYESESNEPGNHSLIVDAKKGDMEVAIKDIPQGEYVVQVLQDVNGNHAMDYNFIGMPKEFWGMSQNPKIKLNRKLWDFDEVKVKIEAENPRISIRMRKLR